MNLTRRRFTQGLATSAVLAGFPLQGDAGMAETMADKARKLLAAFSEDQRGEALLAMDSEARRDWHFFPRSRPGVPMGKMTDGQRTLLRELLALLFSTRGLDKVDGVIRLEKVLYDQSFFSFFRDPGNYAVVFFGTPSDSKAWAWRFEGHHLSVSATVVPGLGIAATPAFFGANPQTVAEPHAHAGLRVLKAEEDLAFQLVNGLSGAARKAAMLADHDLDDIVAGPGRELSLKRISGVPVGGMDAAGRGLVENLLDAYVGNMSQDIARRETARVREAGWDKLHLGWAGSTQPGQPHYYRLHGPTVIIEYDNSRGGANHVHSVWHNPTNLFGEDMLKRHYATGGH